MKEIKGDLLEGDWDVAFHCANPHCVMGSGIAFFLKQKWPQVYDADLKTENETPESKMGHYSFTQVEFNKTVFNLYGQQGIGNDGTVLGRNCSYDDLYDAMFRACDHICAFKEDVKIGVPKYMGCCRAGGDWIIVSAMLESIENMFPVEFIIYDIENGENDNRIESSTLIDKINHESD